MEWLVEWVEIRDLVFIANSGGVVCRVVAFRHSCKCSLPIEEVSHRVFRPRRLLQLENFVCRDFSEIRIRILCLYRLELLLLDRIVIGLLLVVGVRSSINLVVNILLLSWPFGLLSIIALLILRVALVKIVKLMDIEYLFLNILCFLYFDIYPNF